MNEEMIPILMVGLSIGIVIISIVIGINYSKKQKETLKQTAMKLGLNFTDGMSAMDGGNAFQGQLPQGVNMGQVQSMMKNPVFSALMSLNSSWNLSGKYNNVPVRVYYETRGSGKSRTSYTIFEAQFTGPEGSGMVISREGFFSGIGKALFKMQDIQTGNMELDKMALIKGKDEMAVKTFLSNPSNQHAVMDIFRSLRDVQIFENVVHVEYVGTYVKYERLKEELDRLVMKVAAFRK